MLVLERHLRASKEHPLFEYPMRMHDGHILVDSGGMTLLMDTGAPFSVGSMEFDFAGRVATPRPSFEGTTVEDLSENIGKPLDALVGMDVMADFDLCFDAPNGKLVVTSEEMEMERNALPISFVREVPVVQGSLPGERHVSLVFDTGAKLSYIGRELLAGTQSYRGAEDFYPGYGPFETAVYRVPLGLGGVEYDLDFAVLPAALERTLLPGLANGILGSEIIVDRKVVLSRRRERLYLEDSYVEKDQ
jgi:hypothetical protein